MLSGILLWLMQRSWVFLRSGFKKTDSPTSVTAVLIHPDGERNFVVQKGASQQLREEEISDEIIKKLMI